MRIYGGGILSSMGETKYALESEKPERKALTVLDALRTPYRIDIFQSIYFVIENFEELYALINQDLLAAIKQAQTLGQFEPTFPLKGSPDDQVFKTC